MPPTPSKKPLKPFMAYIEEAQHTAMLKYAKKANVPMSQLVREAIALRIAPSDPYRAGFNDGLNKAIEVINANTASKMRFPSGKSFAELINADIDGARMNEAQG